ncbi:MAG: DNA replication and repair protein RecF [Bacteroidia bacterium]|nr:DNA replication and repair protein RecF [Bacteroidia bacterium]
MKRLRLTHLEMIQFKNHEKTSTDLQGRLVCITGDNGMGKTNILDAIYVLCMSKSYISFRQADIIQNDKDFTRLVGSFERNGDKDLITLKYPRNGTKIIEKNGKKYTRLRDHIGFLPVVIITPDDVQLLLGGSADRRTLLDNTLCQVDRDYFTNLSQYNYVLKQRNSFLKSDIIDDKVLDIYDSKLIEFGKQIYDKRKQFFSDYAETVSKIYAKISGEKEDIEVTYKSQLNDQDFATLFQGAREKDRILQRTTTGIHKDDMDLLMNKHPVKSVASQGQRKSLLLSLKIAQFEIIKTQLQVSPLILLDDLFDKLDRHRVAHLIQLLTDGDFGQIILTDTNKTRVKETIGAISIDADWLEISNGQISNYEYSNS